MPYTTPYSDFTCAPIRLFERYESYKISCVFPAAHLISEIICLDSIQEFVFNLSWIWAWYRQEHISFVDLSRGNAGNFFFPSRHQASSNRQGCLGHALPYWQAAVGVPSYYSHCSELHFLSLSPCQSDSWNAASSATLVLLFLPRQPECGQWRRQGSSISELTCWDFVCVKKGYFFLQQRTRKRLVSYTKLPQENRPRTHVILPPWDLASSLYFSGWISDQRSWGLQGRGNIIAVKHSLNEITWRHSAVQKKK